MHALAEQISGLRRKILPPPVRRGPRSTVVEPPPTLTYEQQAAFDRLLEEIRTTSGQSKTLTLAGPSGSGKSVVVRHLAELLPQMRSGDPLRGQLVQLENRLLALTREVETEWSARYDRAWNEAAEARVPATQRERFDKYRFMSDPNRGASANEQAIAKRKMQELLDSIPAPRAGSFEYRKVHIAQRVLAQVESDRSRAIARSTADVRYDIEEVKRQIETSRPWAVKILNPAEGRVYPSDHTVLVGGADAHLIEGIPEVAVLLRVLSVPVAAPTAKLTTVHPLALSSPFRRIVLDLEHGMDLAEAWRPSYAPQVALRQSPPRAPAVDFFEEIVEWFVQRRREGASARFLTVDSDLRRRVNDTVRAVFPDTTVAGMFAAHSKRESEALGVLWHREDPPDGLIQILSDAREAEQHVTIWLV